MHLREVNKAFGNIDIYLLDQILKGRFEGKIKLLDAGCGEGRNLNYFVENGFDAQGNDIEPLALKMAQMTYRKVPSKNFVHSAIEDLDYPKNTFDVIICGAVLHFAKDQSHFDRMLNVLSKILKKNGVLFIRMATDVGVDKDEASPFTYHLPKDLIEDSFSTRGLTFLESWKSVVVEGKRSMGTFILSKV